MKKVFFFGAILAVAIAFQSFTTQPYYAENTKDGEEKLINVDIRVNGIYRDSLFWFMDVDIKGPGASGKIVTASAKLKGNLKQLGNHEIQRGAKGKGTLNVPDRGNRGSITIMGLSKNKLTSPVGSKVLGKFREG